MTLPELLHTIKQLDREAKKNKYENFDEYSCAEVDYLSKRSDLLPLAAKMLKEQAQEIATLKQVDALNAESIAKGRQANYELKEELKALREALKSAAREIEDDGGELERALLIIHKALKEMP